MELPLGQQSEHDKWLEQHPTVLGGGALLIGLVLLASGIYELRTGVTRGKYGEVLRGSWGTFNSILRIVGGAVACVFGLYKMLQ